MLFTASIQVMPHANLLDPQGKAVEKGLVNMGVHAVSAVRVGKNISLQIEAENAEKAKLIAENAGKQLLANPVMENYTLHISEN